VGLNFIDIYPAPGFIRRQLSERLGGEGAGVVLEVGPGVTDLKPGDRCGLWQRPARRLCRKSVGEGDVLIKLPDGIDDKTAAAMMLKA